MSRSKLLFPVEIYFHDAHNASVRRPSRAWTHMYRIKQLKRHGERENSNVGQIQLDFTNIKS